jgi:hypothetical protein
MAARGTCFEESYNLFTNRCENEPADRDNLRLVHGHVINKSSSSKRVAHAWIEDLRTNVVLDYSNGLQLRVPRTSYFEKFSVPRAILYSYTEALECCCKQENYGPWEDWLNE